ncbi:MAG: hypothetical protein RBT78_03955 [Kiritimatiellia bacterium]|jgi:hypothetical protein|nr:hypothetical protein [Kiritimatiellia bacterium]
MKPFLWLLILALSARDAFADALENGFREDVNHLVYPKPKMEFMSEAWRAMAAHTVREAARLGLTVSVNLSSCAGALKGPWAVGADAPKRLAYQLLPLRPGLAEFLAKPAPFAHVKDVAAFTVWYAGNELPAAEWRAESGGPWVRSPAVFGEADQLAFLGRTDMPQGEFWYTG